MAQQQNANPQIKWDGKNFSVTLPVAATLELKKGGVVEAKWNPNLTFVVRVREVGTDKWSFGFETPLTCCTLVDLKPDTEYEMQVRGKNAAGEGEAAYLKTRTNSKGDSGNIIPFPKR